MALRPTFLHSIEVRRKKKLLTREIQPFEMLMQEKHQLENTHKIMVTKALNPFLEEKVLKSGKVLTRNTEFLMKKVHHINCPAVPSANEVIVPEKPVVEAELIIKTTETDTDFLRRKIPNYRRGLHTSVTYAEDLFGPHKSRFPINNSTPRASTIRFQSKINNKYTRKVAGSDTNTLIMSQKSFINDPLEAAESKLPQKFRSLTKNSPWVYSSVLRIDRIFKVKTKRKHQELL